MESTPDTQTASLWTDEKHLHYLNTMEASFVRTMLHHYAVVSPLRLDRYLPDTSESTLDSKPKKQATADSMGGSRGRRTKRRSSSKNKVQNSSPAEEQGVTGDLHMSPQDGSKLEKGIESAACGQGGDDKEPIEN
ncbi:uncharacterized protein [Glycine max]|uniref:uncharacterized protein isoform X2 n=1 Tax=Glycine max TaxID=3847 RepID=UPI00023CD48E|nr:uncharacterized protein LOC100792832 isoform X2 [Glycine max]|eukprot:XP_006589556.1 uncharacterized protein LOC100792832 isoform X2 [Glycine max]